ncbi:MAG: hypothetical protein QXU61_02975 [Archaeoglobaceae archaeon]
MKLLVNFVSVNVHWNRKKILDYLKASKFEAIFMDLPEDFEPYIANASLPPEDFGWTQDLKASRCLFDFCWKEKVSLYCYLPSTKSREIKDTQIELAKLVLKSKIGKIDVEEWREIILRDLEERKYSYEDIALKIKMNAKNRNACLNLPAEVENRLKNDFLVNTVVLYNFRRPIDLLYELAKRELEGFRVDKEVWIRAIKGHIAFIDCVLEVGYEEACKIFEFWADNL